MAEDIERLLGGGRLGGSDAGGDAPSDEGAFVDGAGGGFVAPGGQTGDGRTSLNDKLGY